MARSLAFAALLLVPTLAFAEPAPGSEAITLEAVKAGITHLASDALEGRGSGEEGGRKAGDWLAAECKKLGLQPGGDDGTFFQKFTQQRKNMRNVIATLPGTESGEMIVIGAHYDHLGLGHQPGSLAFGQGRGKIHNGADDNASGSQAVLEVAKAFVASGQKPKRRVVFMWFDGEERGLLGSAHFVKNPTISDRCTLMINLDMVGKLKGSLNTFGVPTGGDRLKAWVDEAAQEAGLTVNVRETVNSNSDHASFYKQNTPVLVPFTGLHKDYHRPTDDVEGINFEGVVKISKFSHHVAYEAANAEENAVFAKAKDGTMEAMMEQFSAMFGDGENMPEQLKELFGGRGDGEGGFDMSKLRERMQGLFGGRRRARRAQLGVVIDQNATGPGVAVREVRPNTIAEKAGMKAGDRIVGFAGEQVDSLQTLRGLIRRADGDVEVTVERGGERLALSAPFPSRQPAKPKPTTPPVPPKSKVPEGGGWF